MGLTHQDLEVLSKPFPAKAHKFNQGLPYIHEVPVGQRLDLVDPSWEWHIMAIERRPNAGQGGKDVGTVYVHVSLIVKGVRRDGVGMAVIQQTNPIEIKKWDNAKRENVGTGEFYTNEANEAEKSATTDAFKRAFRMFGGGRYLLAIPKDDKGKLTVSNVGQLDTWLKTNYGEIQDIPTYYDDENEAQSPSPLEPDFHNLGNSTPATSEKRTAPITAIEVKFKDDKPYLVASGMTIWSRQPFRDLAFDSTIIEKLGKPNTTVYLPKETAIVISYSEEKQGGKTVKKPLSIIRTDNGAIVKVS